MAKKTLIHLSDLHIGGRSRYTERTRFIFNKIARAYPGIPVIITGDLTNSAKKSQFQETRALLDRLARTNPVLMVPGNHDYAWLGNVLRKSGWADWVRHLGKPLGWGGQLVDWMGVNHEVKEIDGLGVWQKGPLAYFGVDSGDPKDKQASARGYISDELAIALRQALLKYKDKTRIVMLHHHPFTHGWFTELDGSDKLMNAVKGRCELLLFGHEHKYGLWWKHEGVPLIVSSHKTTDCLAGGCLMITLIDIDKPGTKEVSFSHRLEIV
jgi:3',5'-cyclic AMP phosphodiesterase CpdA